MKVIRVPTGEKPSLIAQQMSQLRQSISNACTMARSKKSQLRMLLDDEELDPYLQFAFDHFAETLETPFDFVEASFAKSPIPHNLGGNILKVAINIMEVRPFATADEIFSDLAFLVASCLMLESARSRLRG